MITCEFSPAVVTKERDPYLASLSRLVTRQEPRHHRSLQWLDTKIDALKAGAIVLAPNGKPFTAASIGPAIATRAIMADLRAGMGAGIGGPPPFSKADRSQFLQALDAALVRLSRAG